MNKDPKWLVCVLLLVGGVTSSFAETTFFGPERPYLSAEDTPDGFFCNLCDDCVTVLEDFEDQSLDHGIMIEGLDAQIIGPDFTTGLNGVTDSVDGDDGVIDGVGNEAHSFFSPGNTLTITFPKPMKSAGFAWTDGDRNTGTRVEFFGPDGETLGSIGPRFLADSGFQGSTGEDAFFGAQDPDGISSIVVTNIGGSGIEIDHIQYEDCSACVPEPSANVLVGSLIGVLAIALRRRRRS